MSRSKCNRVFILGAGCSANYGYPLGVKFVEELRKFLDDKILKIPGRCPIIQDAVRKSIDMAARFPQADTLDKLVKLFEERFKTFSSGRGVIWENADTEQENLTDEQILNAKIATAALFLDKESEARKTALKGYKEFLLPTVFGRDQRWQSAVNGSDCSVLTFNYDRLFEIAFLDYIKDFQCEQFPLYGKSVLNSGFDPISAWGRKKIEIEPGRFCFLKLHGSAGWWAKMCATNQADKWRDYCPNTPHIPTDLVQLEQCLAENKKLEPLIAFPHEKQRFTSAHPGDFVQGPYIGEVWAHAAAVLGEATEVIVIGYSFAEIDRTHMVENLLRKTPKTTTIRIVNKDVEAVRHALENCQDLQDRLKLGRLEFIKKIF